MTCLSLFLLSVLLASVHATAKIKCISCVAPQTGIDLGSKCNDDTFCTGIWCTKGPDARSSGTLYGCTDQAPLEISMSTCKAVNGSRGLYYNCYCNNIEFCNGGMGLTGALPWLIAIVSLGYLNA